MSGLTCTNGSSCARTYLAAPISEGRARFMARGGILASSLFLGGMVLHALGILMLAPCK